MFYFLLLFEIISVLSADIPVIPSSRVCTTGNEFFTGADTSGIYYLCCKNTSKNYSPGSGFPYLHFWAPFKLVRIFFVQPFPIENSSFPVFAYSMWTKCVRNWFYTFNPD